ncbi:hypothetical protein GCM10009681_51200 [Luedemannella helvata]|uniref:O-antigen ligase domain-containing protein n=1 Tax=Luedemannella helvata TaxID=349315 RepID=A0ABP4X9N6_9ACTN
MLVVAAFGPYLPLPGVRTEQVVVYLAFLVTLLSGHWTRVPVGGTAVVLGLLTTILLIAVMGTFGPVPLMTSWPAGSVTAGLDNLLLPIAVVLTVGATVHLGVDRRRTLTVVCRLLVAGMCANAILAYASTLTDLSPVLARWWNNGPVDDLMTDTVAGRASGLGRFSGIFNQPAEAGIAYALALFAALYLAREAAALYGVAAVVIAVGGVLSVSKVFLLIGLPIALWQAIRHTSGRRLAPIVAAMAVVVMAYQVSGADWAGAGYLTRLFGAGDDVLGWYTAGRIGDESTLYPLVLAVLRESPWFGFGAGGLAAPYDNGWVEALCVAGLAGVVIYTAVLGVLVALWLRKPTDLEPATARFAGGVVLVLTLGSVGVPALTANRVATLAWVLLTLLLLARPDAVREPNPPVRIPARIATRHACGRAPVGQGG